MTLSKSKIKYVHSLKDRKGRAEHKTFVAQGDKIVADLLPCLPCRMLVATSDFLNNIDKSSLSRVDEIVEVTAAEIAKVSFVKSPQQAVGVFCQQEYQLDESCFDNQLCIALDAVQDPGNLGTIVRLADWYGIDNIFCSHDTADIYNPKVVQATMGAIARVKVHYVELTPLLSGLEKIPVYGTFLDGRSIYETELSETGLIVMGNEGRGIGSDIKKLISHKLYVPNYPPERVTSESLNVAVATAVVCAEFRRRQF